MTDNENGIDLTVPDVPEDLPTLLATEISDQYNDFLLREGITAIRINGFNVRPKRGFEHAPDD